MVVPRKLPPDTLRFLEKSDEEIGDTIRTLYSDAYRKAFSKRGRRAVSELLVLHWLFEEAERLLDRAIQDPAHSLHHLAYCLALRGESQRAGKSLRTFYTAVFPMLRDRDRVAAQESARLKKLIAKSIEREENLARWFKAGIELRKRTGWPISNLALARQISLRVGGSVSTIRQELPALGLDAAEWRERIRAENRVKRSSESAQRKKQSQRKGL